MSKVISFEVVAVVSENSIVRGYSQKKSTTNTIKEKCLLYLWPSRSQLLVRQMFAYIKELISIWTAGVTD